MLSVFPCSPLFCLGLLAVGPEENSLEPPYDAKGNLVRPADYRDWEFLSAGYGINYSPAPGSQNCQIFANDMNDMERVTRPTRPLK